MRHAERCTCPDCLRLDRRWPNDGHQLRLIEQGPKMLAPDDDEAARRLFELAGQAFGPTRQGRFTI